MPDVTDIALAREFAASNSEPAFAELVRRHINLVYSVALRYVGNAQDAQDVTQAVFIILARKAAGLRGYTVLTGWLYETTRFTALRFLRSNTRRQFREQEAYMQSTSDESDTDNVWRQLAPLLEEAMTRLNEKERTLLALRFFENRTGAETAALLGIEEWAGRKRANRALEKLRKFFTKRGITFSVAAIAGAVSANSVHAAPAGLAKTISVVAIAKGAAAGGSTLALVKGALKLMAWAKMKTAAVTGAVLILAAATTITAIYHHRHSPPHQTGRMKLPTGDVTPMIAYSYSHNVFILASDGSLWSWGEDRFGWPDLGYTNVENSVSLRRIGSETDWVSITVSGSQCLAIKSDGTLWGWGENLNYQLGDGTKITRPTPVPSVPGNDWKQAAIGGSSSFALKKDGTLWAWGDNWAGQLGIGDMKATTHAVQVGTSANWTKIWAGGIQTVGLQSDGSLWFWGSLSGSSSDKAKNITVPTRVSPDTNWTDVCFGYFTMFALKSDGTLWTWGLTADIYNAGSDKGLDGSGVQLTPVQIGTESDWQSFSSAPACFYLLLRKQDGSLWALDASEHRTIKPASQYKPMAPRKIDFHKDIAAYAAGGDNIGLILTPDGEVWTWGNVLGEFSPKDYQANDKQPFLRLLKQKVIDKPWQVLNIP